MYIAASKHSRPKCRREMLDDSRFARTPMCRIQFETMDRLLALFRWDTPACLFFTCRQETIYFSFVTEIQYEINLAGNVSDFFLPGPTNFPKWFGELLSHNFETRLRSFHIPQKQFTYLQLLLKIYTDEENISLKISL